jgi:serine/threonine protein kinase/Tol biopolymer transport system component
MSAVKKIGRYEVKSKLGEGGMGEVYLAHDTELDREVAIKVLLPEFCCNLERVNRFKLEAKSASALNHPNIITIYEIGSNKDSLYIVTEYIKGETLRNFIQQSGINTELALDFAQQIASALTAAHKEGIVHRDIKPENIMVREDGILKVLDFGLAKPTQVESEAKTLELVKTKAGMVMGSVGYMSPEQARGKEVDERTDLWSLGVVLYEMLTGITPFDGETMTDILANIIHKDPLPISEHLLDAPTELHRMVKKSLRKNADDRYQTAKDFVIDLKSLRRELGVSQIDGFMTGQISKVSTATTGVKFQNTEDAKTLLHHSVSVDEVEVKKTAVTTRSIKTRNWWLPIAVVTIAILIAVGAWFFRPSGGLPVDLNSLEISTVEGGEKAFSPAISADGKYLAYVNYENGKKSLVVKQIATGSTVQVVAPLETGGFLQPVFSPDGNYIYYVIADKGIGTLYQVPSLGGTSKKIVADVDSKVAVAPDGKRIAFKRRSAENGVESIHLINADGTNEELFTTSKDLNIKGIYEIAWSPKDNHLLVGGMSDFLIDELVKSKLLLVSVADKSVRTFGEKEWFNAGSFNWAKDGASIFMLAKPTSQEPSQIWHLSYPEGLELSRITNDSSGYEQMGYASEVGVFTGSKNAMISSVWLFNPATREMNQLTSENKNLIGAGGFALMPDGRLIVSKIDNNKANLWTLETDGKNEKQLTNEDGFNAQAAVSPDGHFVVYTSTRTKFYSIWRIDASGKNPLQLTRPDNAYDSKPIILADNKTVIFERRAGDFTRSTLMKVSLEGGESTPVFQQEAAMQMFPRLSNDGSLIAFSTLEFDKESTKFNRQVKVFSLNGKEIGSLKKKFDLSLGYYYNFSPDNKNLTYINQQGIENLYNLPLDGTPQKPLTTFTSGQILNFSWAKDGKKIYIVRGIINNELVLLKNKAKG